MYAEAQIAAGRFAHHGGRRLGVARSLFPNVPQPSVDLSTGINPRAYPAPRASQRARNRLPEPTELARPEALAAGLAAHADRLLSLSGFELAGGTSLFRLARAPDARERFSRLLAAGILARPFAALRGVEF